MDKKTDRRSPMGILIKVLLASYILTACLLTILSCLLMSFGLSERIVRFSIIFIYVSVTFLAGLIFGKRMEHRKYLWGMSVGAAYFIVLFIISILANKEGISGTGSVFTTMVLCLGGGMMGGMFG